MPPIEPIRTERLVLREYVMEDWPALRAYNSDPEVMRYSPGVASEEDTWSSLAVYVSAQGNEPRKRFDLAVTLAVDGQLIGGCDIYNSWPERREWSVGYVVRRDCWGQGYATEAAQALVAMAVERLGAHRIIANCAIGNVASARVMEKLGMQREGIHRRQTLEGTEWRDTYSYAILEDDWRARHE